MDGVGGEFAAALEETEFDEHGDADEVGTEFVKQLDGCGRSAAGGEQVIRIQRRRCAGDLFRRRKLLRLRHHPLSTLDSQPSAPAPPFSPVPISSEPKKRQSTPREALVDFPHARSGAKTPWGMNSALRLKSHLVSAISEEVFFGFRILDFEFRDRSCVCDCPSGFWSLPGVRW